jgi:hypothetical protein
MTSREQFEPPATVMLHSQCAPEGTIGLVGRYATESSLT